MAFFLRIDGLVLNPFGVCLAIKFHILFGFVIERKIGPR